MKTRAETARDYLSQVLAKANGSIGTAAQLADLNIATLTRMIARYKVPYVKPPVRAYKQIRVKKQLKALAARDAESSGSASVDST